MLQFEVVTVRPKWLVVRRRSKSRPGREGSTPLGRPCLHKFGANDRPF